MKYQLFWWLFLLRYVFFIDMWTGKIWTSKFVFVGFVSFLGIKINFILQKFYEYLLVHSQFVKIKLSFSSTFGIRSLILFVTMWVFPCFNKIIEIKASSKLIDLVALFIDDIKRIVVTSQSVIIKCVCWVIWCIWVIQLIRSYLINLAVILRGRVVISLVVTHIVHVIIRIGRVIIISLTWILKLFYLEGLFNQNILNIIWQVVYLILPIIIVLLLWFWFAQNLHFQILYFDFVKKVELWPTDYSLWFLWILAVWIFLAIRIFVVVIFHVVIVLLTFLWFQSKWKITHQVSWAKTVCWWLVLGDTFYVLFLLALCTQIIRLLSFLSLCYFYCLIYIILYQNS